jgi:hypothetical protein
MRSLSRVSPVSLGFLPGAALLGVVAVLVWFRNLLGVDPERFLWADNFDPYLLRWTAEWGYLALGEARSWSLFWNAPIFYPHTDTLAYSDSLLTLQVLYTPLRILGVPPLTALYIGLGLTAVGCFVLTVWLVGRLEIFSHLESMIVGFVAHFSLMFAAFLPHYQLFGFHFAPPFFIALYLFFSTRRVRWLILAEVCFALGACFSVYLGPSLVVLGLVVAGVCMARTKAWSDLRTWRALALPGLVSTALIGGMVYGVHVERYVHMVGATAPQSLEEVATYSARPASLVSGRSIQSRWWRPYGGGYQSTGDWERAYFPGFVLLLGFVLGVGSLVASTGSVTGSLREFSAVMFTLFVAAIVLSWGPFVDGQRMPYYFLSDWFPPLRNTRAMGRYGMFAALPLGVFLVVAMRSFYGRMGGVRSIGIGVVTFVAVGIESVPTGAIYPFEEPLRERHIAVRSIVAPGEGFAELPVAGVGHFETIRAILEQMNGTLHHHGRLVVGYSGRRSPESAWLIELDQVVPRGETTRDGLRSFLREPKVDVVLIHLDRYPAAAQANMAPGFARASGFEEIGAARPAYVVLRRSEVGPAR